MKLDHSKTIQCPACGGDWPPNTRRVRAGRLLPCDRLPIPGDTRTHGPQVGGCGASFFVERDLSLRPMDEGDVMNLPSYRREDLFSLITGTAIPYD